MSHTGQIYYSRLLHFIGKVWKLRFSRLHSYFAQCHLDIAGVETGPCGFTKLSKSCTFVLVFPLSFQGKNQYIDKHTDCGFS